MEKASKAAYAGDEHEFGRKLVELADEVISAGKVYSPGALLSELLSKAGVMTPARSFGTEQINPTSPAALFDVLTSNNLPGPREYFNQFFEVVAAPRSRIEGDLHPGDLLVSRALGEGNLAHVALIVTGEALRAKELAAIGLRPDSWRPGLFVEVIDAGPFPHCREDKFVRRVGDENGLLSHGCLILRARYDAQNSIRSPFPLLEEQEETGSVVDEDAAEPIFVGPVRIPTAPLPDLAALKAAIEWNKKMHPKESGISLAELQARLEKYIDRAALDDLARKANAGATTPPYGSDEATMVTLLAEQFQRKTCRKPSIGDIWKQPTMDGKVEEDTLDALGFVYHLGKKTTLNLADLKNTTADNTLKKVKAIEFKDLEPGLTAKTWWTYMVRPPWLGMPIKQGIHLVLLKRLRQAQKFLMGLRAYENLSPAELGKVLGLEEEHKGARPTAATKSMHTFGLGIDISITHNPWLSDPDNDTSKIAGITQRAAQLIGGKPGSQKGITPRLLHQIAVDNQDTSKIYKILSEFSSWLGSYFALANDPKRIESLLPALNAANTDLGLIKPGESVADAAKRRAGIIKSDFNDFATAVDRGGNEEAVRNGFMDLPRDLVLALREYACLGWGAVDFGPGESGDIMHFDCRVDGIGRAIRIATGLDAPTEGHRCIPAEARQVTSREFAEDDPKPAPPPPPKSVPPPPPIRYESAVIPRYKDADNVMRSTNCSIIFPTAARNKKDIDVMVFFHGHDSCHPKHCFHSDKVVEIFKLDTQVENSKQEVALAVPAIYWNPGNDVSKNAIQNAWSAANLNKFVDEALDQIKGQNSGLRPNLRNLILAGHSGVYAILTPLATKFKSDAAVTTAAPTKTTAAPTKTTAAPTKEGALAQLSQVLAIDTTYGTNNAISLVEWARQLESKKVKFFVVLNDTGKSDCRTDCDPSKETKKCWDCASKGKLPANLEVILGNGHCELPQTTIQLLLEGKLGTGKP